MSFFRFLLSGMLMFILLSGVQAHHLPEFRIVNAGLGKQFGVSVAGLPQANAIFEVKTVQGEVLLHQRIRTNEFSKLYSLEELAEGNYLLTLRTAQELIVQPVQLTRRAIFYKLEERQVVFTPEVSLEGRQLDVNYDNPNQAPFTIRLRDGEGTLLYEQEFEEMVEIEQRINLLRLPAGAYLLDMQTDSRTWQQDLVLR